MPAIRPQPALLGKPAVAPARHAKIIDHLKQELSAVHIPLCNVLQANQEEWQYFDA
jgi:hypothetical protein